VVGGAPPDDPGYKPQLEGEASKLGLAGRITFTGFRTDVPKILDEVAISVLPSLSEGLSNVLLESMGAGVPVVATTVGGNTEIIDGGITGLLIRPCDSDALARSLLSLLENPALARKLGEAGKKKIRATYSVRAMVERTEQHYCKLLMSSMSHHSEIPLENAA
jgi:glycosyltransferase involved in cell wall biosynthesis